MIYFIAKSSASAGSSRQRAFIMAEFLRNAGFPAEVIAPPEYPVGATRAEKWAIQRRYLRTIFSIKKNDTVILQNIIRNIKLICVVAVVRFVRRPRMIFDIDDGSYMRNPWIVKILVALSDKIIVGSHRLAEWPGFQHKPRLIVPNLVDWQLAARYSVKRPVPAEQPVVIGWIGGGPGSIANLKLLIPVFEKLIAKKAPFIFRLIGTLGNRQVEGLFSDIPGLAVEFVDTLGWGKPGEIQKANAGFDIGVCPLVDNEENRVRCSLKVLDYMAVGIPAVISPIGENNYFIEDGVQGFLPTTSDDWAEKLALLIHDPNLRHQMGLAGRKRVTEQFSYQNRIASYTGFIL